MPSLVAERVAALDWRTLEDALWQWGYATTPALLTPDECRALVALYPDDSRFRSRIDMERYRFGVGDYKYFAEPLPPLVAQLREQLYPPLAAVANRWEAPLSSSLPPRPCPAARPLPARRPDQADSPAPSL